MKSLWTLLVLLCAAGVTAEATVAAEDLAQREAPGDYTNLPESKALAVVIGHEDNIFGIGHTQPTDTAASATALKQCEANYSRLREIAATPGQACEVVKLNGEKITTGADIRAQVPTSPHPLYLWRYSSPTSTVYLAGSIHVLKATLYPLAPQLEEAFERSDLLVLEVDAEKYPLNELQAKMMDIALLPEGQTLKKVLTDEQLNRLYESLSSYGINPQQIAQFKPSMVMNQLVVLRLQALGYLPEHGLEQHFRKKLGKKRVLELESVELQLDLLFNQPLEVQIQLLIDTLELEHEIEPLLSEMLSAWLAGDDTKLLKLVQQQSGESENSEAFNKRLLDDRNVGMANTIKRYLETTGTYFVLVGAAHFIGESGIIRLLEQQGVTGQRIMSDEKI